MLGNNNMKTILTLAFLGSLCAFAYALGEDLQFITETLPKMHDIVVVDTYDDCDGFYISDIEVCYGDD